MSDIVLYSLGGLIFYQAYATIRVVRHKSYTPEKKRHQLLIIWLVPFVGAALLASRRIGKALCALTYRKSRTIEIDSALQQSS